MHPMKHALWKLTIGLLFPSAMTVAVLPDQGSAEAPSAEHRESRVNSKAATVATFGIRRVPEETRATRRGRVATLDSPSGQADRRAWFHPAAAPAEMIPCRHVGRDLTHAEDQGAKRHRPMPRERADAVLDTAE